MLSATAEYALRAMVYLARHGDPPSLQAKDLAAAMDVSLSYMRKILHELVRAGILASTRGKQGGFHLARAPGDLPLLTIVSRFDRASASRRCLLGRTECSDRHPCPVHDHWKAAAEAVAAFYANTTLADVLGPDRVGRAPRTGAGRREAGGASGRTADRIRRRPHRE